MSTIVSPYLYSMGFHPWLYVHDMNVSVCVFGESISFPFVHLLQFLSIQGCVVFTLFFSLTFCCVFRLFCTDLFPNRGSNRNEKRTGPTVQPIVSYENMTITNDILFLDLPKYSIH